MGDLTTFETIIIAIVEGLTEFLPVSSTGHMIITQNILGVESTEFVKAEAPAGAGVWLTGKNVSSKGRQLKELRQTE